MLNEVAIRKGISATPGTSALEIAAFLLTASEATAEKHYDGEHQ